MDAVKWANAERLLAGLPAVSDKPRDKVMP
jgi:hypothetical protein